MKTDLHPAFRDWDAPGTFERVREYSKPDGLEISYRAIPGVESGSEIEIKIYTPVAAATEKLPMIMNIHGGGFVGGDYNTDDKRVSSLAMGIPAIVVSLNYRLAPQFTYKETLADCYRVWNWMHDAAGELGGKSEQMGLYGTSAGGNMCAGLAFYIRDHGGPSIALNALNTPVLGLGPTLSSEQLRDNGPLLKGEGLAINVRLYAGGLDGGAPSYYAVPNAARDFSGLPPTLVIAAEYDPLRDESMDYVRSLQRDAIPVEFYLTPRTMHGFNVVTCDVSEWINAGTVMSFKREFSK